MLSSSPGPWCGWLFQWSVGRNVKPKPAEPSVCGWCGALVIFTDKFALRPLDWPDWCQLSHTQAITGVHPKTRASSGSCCKAMNGAER